MPDSEKNHSVQAKKANFCCDIHAHFVPGVDDGPSTEQETAAMVSLALEGGTDTVAATPHVIDFQENSSKVEDVLHARDRWLHRAADLYPDIYFVPGAEVYASSNILDLLTKFGSRLTLNRSRYFLLEFPFDMIFPGIEGLIFEILRKGYIPVIAHPERNQVIQRNPGVVYDMVSLGALAQVNAGSLRGEFGSEILKCAGQLLSANLVHAVSSDAHGSKHRKPGLADIPALLEKIGVHRGRMLIDENPRRIIENRAVKTMGEPLKPRGNRSFVNSLKRFWNGG